MPTWRSLWVLRYLFIRRELSIDGSRTRAPYVIINQGKTDHDSYPDLALRLEGDVTEIFPLSVEEALTPVS